MTKGKIFIIEDSFIVLHHLKTTLEGEGFQVIGVSDSGEAALDAIEHNRPDLVLMDVMLSGKMDGIQTAIELRKKFNLPVIYITGLTDTDTIQRAKVTEPYGFLTKPFEDREIFTVIEMGLYKHKIESLLKQSEQKYLATINSISDSVITVNENYCISFMNQTASAITQWTIRDAVNKPVAEVLRLMDETTNEEGVNPLQCRVREAGMNRMPDNLILKGKSGLEVPIGESTINSLLDNRGELIGLVIVFKDMTEIRNHERLKVQIERQHRSALIEGQELERARIAKDLHDGLGQMLNAIKMNVSLIVTDGESSKNLVNLLDEAIQESTRIAENLLPSKLKDFDLAICLRALCQNINNTTQSTISFEARGDQFNMSQTHKVNFYRIAQEAMSNSVRHANAKQIMVQLSETEQAIQLSIEDNGSGISNGVNAGGQKGMTNMRDRAEIMGGKFSIETDNQRGTLVMVEVPTKQITANA